MANPDDGIVIEATGPITSMIIAREVWGFSVLLADEKGYPEAQSRLLQEIEDRKAKFLKRFQCNAIIETQSHTVAVLGYNRNHLSAIISVRSERPVNPDQ